jgi:hypothetical protein
MTLVTMLDKQRPNLFLEELDPGGIRSRWRGE